MPRPIQALAVLAASCLAGSVRADSPLTSIDFADAYPDVPAVQAAKADPTLNGAALGLLLDAQAPNDQKAAVANALGWGKVQTEGARVPPNARPAPRDPRGLAPVFLEAVAKARQTGAQKLRLDDLTPSERFVAGYLAALDDHLGLGPIRKGGPGVWGAKPLALLDSAAAALPDDFAVQFVRALAQAQAAMAGSWCKVFQIPQAVLSRFPEDKRNLRALAVKNAVDYLSLYEKSCPGSEAAKKEEREQLNQIYSLARLGPQVVAGTQGGVVVWDPGQPQAPLAIHSEFICSVLTWEGSAWAGCSKSVVRWDGKAFKAYRLGPQKDAEYFHPMRGPGGTLWIRRGARAWGYDRASDRFTPIQAPWKGDAYDALVAKSGAVWSIDFLRSIANDRRRYLLESADYPGKDPRRFREDTAGRLWVEDFDSGLFRLDPETGRFVREEGLAAKATGVAFDPKTEGLWMLHYTEGPYLKVNGQMREKVDLSALGYMRDLMVDEDGDVWVAGWTQLVRLRRSGAERGQDSFRVR